MDIITFLKKVFYICTIKTILYSYGFFQQLTFSIYLIYRFLVWLYFCNMTVFCSLHITVKPDLAIVNVRTGTCSPLNNKDFLYVNLQETQTGKDNTLICHIKVNIWMIYDNGESFHLFMFQILSDWKGGGRWLVNFDILRIMQ